MKRTDFLKALFGSLTLPIMAKAHPVEKKKPRYLYGGSVAGTVYYD